MCERVHTRLCRMHYVPVPGKKDELMEVYEVMKKNQYGQYLRDVMDGKYQEHLY